MTYVSELETTIRTLRDAVDGEVCTRSRVVDGLLDVRLGAVDRRDLIELVDLALATIPGRTTVPSAWWREQLDMFELATLDQTEPVG